jgi:hypothetical protein
VGMEMTGLFAKALAPFQSPTFKAVLITVSPGERAAAGGAAADRGRQTIEDPAALTRFYQQKNEKDRVIDPPIVLRSVRLSCPCGGR